MSSKNSVNTKFVNAVFHWLSAFPSSPLKVTDPVLKMKEPVTLVQLLKMILDEKFEVGLTHVSDTVVDGSDENDIGVNLEQYQSIFQEILEYFKNRMIPRKKITRFVNMLDYEELNKGVYYHLNLLCFILLEIGLHSYKSSIAISIISTLSDEHQKLLKNFMYDEDDLHGKNLILNREVNLLELNNVVLKEDLRLETNKVNQIGMKLKKLTQELDNKENEIHELNERLQMMEEKHSKEIEMLRLKNKGLNLEVKQLNQELKGELTYTFPRPDEKVSELIIPSTSNDKLLEWEYKVLSDVVRYVYSKKKN